MILPEITNKTKIHENQHFFTRIGSSGDVKALKDLVLNYSKVVLLTETPSSNKFVFCTDLTNSDEILKDFVDRVGVNTISVLSHHTKARRILILVPVKNSIAFKKYYIQCEGNLEENSFKYHIQESYEFQDFGEFLKANGYHPAYIEYLKQLSKGTQENPVVSPLERNKPKLKYRNV